MTVIDSDSAVAPQAAVAPSFDSRLRHLGVPDDSVLDVIEVSAGETARLTADLEATLSPSTVLVTSDVEQYKGWIGRPDDTCTDVRMEMPAPWTAGTDREYSDLTPAEQRTLGIAGLAYLFGDSGRVAEYREVLERYRAPFTAAVYAARRVTIGPDATLVVVGTPAIICFEELTIHRSGRLIAYTAVNAHLGRLHKIEGGPEHG